MAAIPKTRTRESRERSRRRIIEAATELVRERSYAELNVGEIMERAGIGRTIFYRHFDDLGNLLVRASREAIDQLYEAQRKIAEAGPDDAPDDPPGARGRGRGLPPPRAAAARRARGGRRRRRD